jgi:RecG-like helicase
MLKNENYHRSYFVYSHTKNIKEAVKAAIKSYCSDMFDELSRELFNIPKLQTTGTETQKRAYVIQIVDKLTKEIEEKREKHLRENYTRVSANTKIHREDGIFDDKNNRFKKTG